MVVQTISIEFAIIPANYISPLCISASLREIISLSPIVIYGVPQILILDFQKYLSLRPDPSHQLLDDP
jgi:hypothetical protein